MAEDQILSKHLKDFHNRLAELRSDSHLIDFKIVIDGTQIPAHKVVLAASSAYFRGMFSNDTKETSTNRVDFTDIRTEIMQSILDYCYSCQINLTDDNVEEILIAASKLLVEPIQNLCIAYISGRIDATNCLGIANLSDRCGLVDLHKKAIEYSIERFYSVIKEREFLALDEHLLSKLLSTNELNVEEADLFQALIDWTQRDVDNRTDIFDKLVQHIRFTQIEPAKLVAFSLDEVVRNSEACKIAIDQAKDYHLLKGHPSWRNELPENLLKPRDNLKSRQRIFAIGGWDDRFQAISRVEVYNPNENTWCEVPPMVERRCGLGCASFGESLYAIGGHDGQNYLSSVERYDTNVGKWFSDVPSMSYSRTSVGIVVLDGYLYAIGGQTSLGATDKVEKFDFEVNKWSECASLNQRRLGAGVAVLNGYIYVVGGAEINGSVVFESVERYDPRLDDWTFVAPLKTARKHLGCTGYDGMIYAIAGRKDGKELDTAEVYDPSIDKWSDLPKMHMKRHGVGVVEVGGLIYAIGGQSKDAHLNVVEAYNPETMEWVWKKSMISNRLGGGVAIHPLRKF